MTRISVYLLALVTFGMMAFTLATQSETYHVRTDKTEVEWKAYKVGGAHNGHVNMKSGEFQLDGILITSGNFVVDMTSIVVDDTESGKLHNHLHSKDFFNTKAHPTAEFTITESSKVDDKHINVKGNMTIVGETQPIEFKAKVLAQTEDVIIYSAEVDVDRTKYGIDYRSSLGDAFIMDEFKLVIKLVGVHETGK